MTIQLGLLLVISSICTVSIVYAKGFKDGAREGYTRGRAISRHPIATDINR